MKLSIIIVNWNTCELLEGCLSSIYDNPPNDPFEVVVIDNASTDGSSRMVQSRFPRAYLIENQNNVGFAAANNQGILKAAGHYLLLLNPDTVMLPRTLQILIDFIEQNTDAGAIGPMVLNPDYTLQSSCNPMPTLWREFWQLMHLDRFLAKSIYNEGSWDTNVAHRVEVIQGNCLLIRREVLSNVGLLDENFFMFTEEVDLCYRLSRSGWLLFWVPMARIIHYGGQSTHQVSKEMFLELYRSKVKFFRKTRGTLGSLAYKSILIIIAVSRLMWGVKKQLYLELLRSLPNL